MIFLRWQKWVLALASYVVIMSACSMWAQDVTDEQNAYCQGVYDHTFPDYKKTFVKSCAEWLTEHEKSVN